VNSSPGMKIPSSEKHTRSRTLHKHIGDSVVCAEPVRVLSLGGPAW
jgi:hypothetical protein